MKKAEIEMLNDRGWTRIQIVEEMMVHDKSIDYKVAMDVVADTLLEAKNMRNKSEEAAS